MISFESDTNYHLVFVAKNENKIKMSPFYLRHTESTIKHKNIGFNLINYLAFGFLITC